MKNIWRLAAVLALICAVSGYFGSGLALKQGVAVPAVFYWFFFLAIPSISLLLISKNESYNVLILLVNSISVFSMYFLQTTTWYPPGRDTQFEMQALSLMLNNGMWIPAMGTSIGKAISVHPAMHICLASLCAVTSIQPYHIMFIIPWIKGVGFTLFFYLFARNFFFDTKRAFFASMVYLGCVWFVAAPYRETFAEILFMGALWIYSKKKIGFEMKTALILLIFSLAMSHHFTSYIFLLLIVVLYLFDRKRRNKMIHPLLPVTAVLSWLTFVSFTVTSTYMSQFFEGLETVFTLSFPEGPTLAAALYYYTPFENLLILMGPILIGMMALSPFLKEVRSRKNTFLVVITFVFGGLSVAAIFFLIFKIPAMATAFYRIWGFTYVPLSIWGSLFFWKKSRNVRLQTIMSIAIIAIFFASMNLSSISGIKKWYVPRGYMEAYMFSDSMVNTANWCNTHLTGSILGDNLAHDTVASWAYKEVDQYTFTVWYQTGNNKLLRDFNYIILSPWDTVTYSDTFREPIDPFARLPKGLSVVYMSGDLVVYCNSSR